MTTADRTVTDRLDALGVDTRPAFMGGAGVDVYSLDSLCSALEGAGHDAFGVFLDAYSTYRDGDGDYIGGVVAGLDALR